MIDTSGALTYDAWTRNQRAASIAIVFAMWVVGGAILAVGLVGLRLLAGIDGFADLALVGALHLSVALLHGRVSVSVSLAAAGGVGLGLGVLGVLLVVLSHGHTVDPEYVAWFGTQALVAVLVAIVAGAARHGGHAGTWAGVAGGALGGIPTALLLGGDAAPFYLLATLGLAVAAVPVLVRDLRSLRVTLPLGLLGSGAFGVAYALLAQALRA
ncbi:hypothetical protein F0L68_28940 [Solihabitans fulvus]|uniref:Uncharacterized protein n=1 Tax=Solihabitans fulvus TaxID=1892852 RepID=A0A5B2WW07_9PSEU|nr:hypothetical protein [Solihabitans fulvus]KAA2255248.1 hypothetical protein F0L68_28940 [Solihabitans fulvus]